MQALAADNLTHAIDGMPGHFFSKAGNGTVIDGRTYKPGFFVYTSKGAKYCPFAVISNPATGPSYSFRVDLGSGNENKFLMNYNKVNDEMSGAPTNSGMVGGALERLAYDTVTCVETGDIGNGNAAARIRKFLTENRYSSKTLPGQCSAYADLATAKDCSDPKNYSHKDCLIPDMGGSTSGGSTTGGATQNAEPE